jgi:integrase
MLRHTFGPTSFDAGVDLRDVQITARHADPRTTMRYDTEHPNDAREKEGALVTEPATTWTATPGTRQSRELRF